MMRMRIKRDLTILVGRQTQRRLFSIPDRFRVDNSIRQHTGRTAMSTFVRLVTTSTGDDKEVTEAHCDLRTFEASLVARRRQLEKPSTSTVAGPLLFGRYSSVCRNHEHPYLSSSI